MVLVKPDVKFLVENGHTEEAIDTANSIPNDFYKFLALNHIEKLQKS